MGGINVLQLHRLFNKTLGDATSLRTVAIAQGAFVVRERRSILGRTPQQRRDL
jgi:hypothetical protein